MTNTEISVGRRKASIARVRFIKGNGEGLYFAVATYLSLQSAKLLLLNKLRSEVTKYKQIIENDEINKELKIELEIVKKQLHDLQIKHNVIVNVSQLSKKFNKKVIHLVLEKYEVTDGDLIDIDKFRQIIKDMI